MCGRERSVPHHRLMPCTVPVRPEAGFDIDREAGRADYAPKHDYATNLLGRRRGLVKQHAPGPDQPSVPETGEDADSQKLAPEERAIVHRKRMARGVQPGGEGVIVIPEPEKDVAGYQQPASDKQGFPTDQPAGGRTPGCYLSNRAHKQSPDVN